MTRSNDDQAHWFAGRTGINEMNRLRPCLLFAARHPKVFEPNGAQVDLESFQALRGAAGLLPYATRFAQSEPVLRIRETPGDTDPGSGDVLLVEAFHPERRKWESLGQIPFRLRLAPVTLEPIPAPGKPK
jgi:hypothetical protein